MNLRASVASGWMWLLLPALLVTTALPQHAQELTIPQKLAEAGHDLEGGGFGCGYFRRPDPLRETDVIVRGVVGSSRDPTSARTNAAFTPTMRSSTQSSCTGWMQAQSHRPASRSPLMGAV